MTVTYGEQSYSPVAYHTFRVGPFSAVVDVEPEDDSDGRVWETHGWLRRIAEEAFKREAIDFARRAKLAEQAVHAEASKQGDGRE